MFNIHGLHFLIRYQNSQKFGRSIVSGIGNVTEKSSQYVDYHCEPLVVTILFKERWRFPETLGYDCYTRTLFVSSLYTPSSHMMLAFNIVCIFLI